MSIRRAASWGQPWQLSSVPCGERTRRGPGVVVVIAGGPSGGWTWSVEAADGGLGGAEQAAVSDDPHDGPDLGGEEPVRAWAVGNQADGRDRGSRTGRRDERG